MARCDRVDCQSGFTPGPSGTCIDVNECLTNPNACSENEICENTMGSFECINQVVFINRLFDYGRFVSFSMFRITIIVESLLIFSVVTECS